MNRILLNYSRGLYTFPAEIAGQGLRHCGCGRPAEHIRDAKSRAPHCLRSQPMVTGTVKWFDVKKGFGFLVNAAGKDVFVHFSSIEGDGFRALKDGELVEYEEVDSGKGLAARN